MTFEQQWLEYDYNPFILFDANGKIISLNAEAQFLLGNASAQELFKLCTSYASVSFGFKTTFLELEFARYKFFAITVGYEKEEEIGIKLYQTPSFKLKKPKMGGELVNIYTLVDLCISTNSISADIEHKKDFDPAIPDIIIDTNSFIKLLSKIYQCFNSSNKICTKIFYRVGEHIKFEGKKYSLFSVKVTGDIIDENLLNEFEIFATNLNFFIDIQKSVTINIPMITS
jgi:nitrogen-specific signal transduction histidine kinase